jgi:uncharacterized protein
MSATLPSIATGELRFNAIGLVDGRMLFVTYTMRGEIVRIVSARGAEPHEKRKYHESKARTVPTGLPRCC